MSNTLKPAGISLSFYQLDLDRRPILIDQQFHLISDDPSSTSTRFAINCCLSILCLIAGKKESKAPKIQRLVTPLTLQRKRARIADKKKRIAKAKSEAADYQKLLASRLKEQRERRSESLAKKRSRLSTATKPTVAA